MMTFKHDPKGFAGLAVDMPTLALLWKLDAKGRPIEPTATFKPSFPGDGFNHSIQLKPDAGEVYVLPCPCGAGMRYTASKPCPANRADSATVGTCPTCKSWHSIIWKAPKESGKVNFIHC